MRKLKNIDEFQTCGEIMVAAKLNKLAFSCKFCNIIFLQMQNFMRHLQMQHSIKLKFGKQAEEVEVYTVEELVNQKLMSDVTDEGCTSYMIANDSKLVSKTDTKMANTRIEIENQQHEDLGLSNVSIRNALEDCGVSLSPIDKAGVTNCSTEKEKKVNFSEKSLFQLELRSDENDSKTNDNIISNETDDKVTKTPAFSENIKSLLRGIEDLDDVDSLLENLESNISDTKTICSTSVSPRNVTTENESEGMTIYIKPNKLNDFELKDLELDITNGDSNASKQAKYKRNRKTFSEKCSRRYNFGRKLLESVKPVNNGYQQVTNNNKKACKIFKLQSEDQESHISTDILKAEKKTDSDRPINKSLIEALTDALNDDDSDPDLLNRTPEEENEILNQDILKLLKKQFTEGESEEVLPSTKEDQNLYPTINFIDSKIINTFKTEQKSATVINGLNVATKYHKTNLKAKTKTLKTHTKDLLTPALRESNYNGIKTPKKLKNVTTKLQRFTPGKLIHHVNNQERKCFDTNVHHVDNEQTVENFKLSEDITLRLDPKQSSSRDTHFSEKKIALQEAQSQSDCKSEINSLKLRQRKASIDTISSNQMAVSRTLRNSNLDYKSYTINRSTRKKEVLQRMHHIKNRICKVIKEDECTNEANDMRFRTNQQETEKNRIGDIEVLHKLERESSSPIICNNLNQTFENNNNVTSKTNALCNNKKYFLIKSGEKSIRKSLKRRVSSPLLKEKKRAKLHRKTTAKQQNEALQIPSGLESTQLDAAESVGGFLQSDLKHNRLSVENFCNGNMVEDDCKPDESSTGILKMLQQEKEKTSMEKIREENTKEKDKTVFINPNVEDFDDFEDISLLAKFGLNIIKLPLIEDDVTLEERDEMIQRAMKFANIYKNYPRIWSTRNSENRLINEDIDKNFKQLLIEANQSFNLELSLAEMKRLVNLLKFWYTNNFCSKFFEKQTISDATNRYLLMFHYIPKTTKRLNFCEYCEECFATEHRYYTHRIVHTGALSAYTCKICRAELRTLKILRSHESSCNLGKTVETIKSPPKAYPDKNKCEVCLKIFISPEALYEHSKIHLKTIYNCVKCKLVFASAADVQNHTNTCNSVSKHISKPSTARPLMPRAKLRR